MNRIVRLTALTLLCWLSSATGAFAQEPGICWYQNGYPSRCADIPGCRYDARTAECIDLYTGPARLTSMVIDCGSTSQRWSQCHVPGEIHSVRLLRQSRGSYCLEGDNWGQNFESIWTEYGCRGQFRVFYYTR